MSLKDASNGKISKSFSYTKVKSIVMDAIHNRNNTYMHKNRYHFAITFLVDGISKAISDTQAYSY